MNHNKNLSIVISCIDYRFWTETLPLFRKKYGDFDLISMAGASKNLISPAEPEDKIALIKNVKTSIELHDPKRIILTNHLDCGAYGGSKKFNSENEEIEFHKNELLKAKEVIQKEFPEMLIETEFISKNEKGEIILL